MPTYITPVMGFRNRIDIAKEGTPGTPAASGYYRVRAMPTNFTPHAERAMPTGEVVGYRDSFTNVPVPGRQWAEGAIETFVRTDTFGLFMLAALGGPDVHSTPSAGYHKHIIDCSDERPPSLTVHEFLGATVGSTKKAYEYPMMDLNTFSLRFNASEDTGLIAATYNMLGAYFSAIDLPTDIVPSDLTPIASWKPTIQIKDTDPAATRAANFEAGFAAETRLTNFEINFNNNVTRLKSAVGERGDQAHVFGARELSGTLTFVLPDTDSDAAGSWADLANSIATKHLRINMGGHYAITAGNFDQIMLDIPLAMVNGFPPRTVQDGAMIQTVNFNAYRDFVVINGPLRATVWNQIGAAY